MIYTKRYTAPAGLIVAMCDSELLGKVIREGAKELDLDTYSGFYKGEELSEKEAEAIANLPGLFSVNVVGERAVGIFMKKGIVLEESVMRIGKVPYVQIFNVER